jgi:DNA polymerase II small subunit/DNA polymerase delta subunit B
MLGCSGKQINCYLLGENLIDIKKYAKISENDLDILESTLYWGNIAPTCPDTLQ